MSPEQVQCNPLSGATVANVTRDTLSLGRDHPSFMQALPAFPSAIVVFVFFWSLTSISTPFYWAWSLFRYVVEVCRRLVTYFRKLCLFGNDP